MILSRFSWGHHQPKRLSNMHEETHFFHQFCAELDDDKIGTSSVLANPANVKSDIGFGSDLART